MFVQWITRLVRTAYILAASALLAWALMVGLCIVEVRVWRPIATLVFMAGAYGLALWLLVALAMIPLSIIPPRFFSPEPASFDRWSWSVLTGQALLAAALFFPFRSVAFHCVPDWLAYTDAFAFAAASYASVPAAFVLVWPVWRRFRHGRPFPWWTLIPLFIVARNAAAEPLRLCAPEQELWLDSAALVLLTACSVGTGERLFRSAKPCILALATCWALAIFALLGTFSARPGARSVLVANYKGAGRIVARFALLVDIDGDGVSALLGGGDCNDFDDAVSPLAFEIVGNGIDDNCMGGDLRAFDPIPPLRRNPDHAQRSVVLITVDAVRADMLDARHMPELVRLASTSAVFANTYAPAAYTAGSLEALMTGQYVMNMSIVWRQNLGREKSLAKLFSEAAYETSVVLHPWWDASSDNWTIYADFNNRIRAAPELKDSYRDIVGPRVTQQALVELDRLINQQRPFFVWIHYIDPHAEYMPRPGTPFSGRTDDRSRYAQEVWATDREVGHVTAFLENARFFDKGILAIHSDHGEFVNDRGRTGHTHWLDEAILRVVLMLRGQDIPVGKFPVRVQLIDLFPTLLELAAGITAPSAGKHLGAVWRGQERDDRDVVVYSAYEKTRQSAILVERHKLYHDYVRETESLFNLRRDPQTIDNLIEQEPDVARRLRDRFGVISDRALNDVILKRRAQAMIEALRTRDAQKR